MNPTTRPSLVAILRDPSRWPLLFALPLSQLPPAFPVGFSDLAPYFQSSITVGRFNWLSKGRDAAFESVQFFTAELGFQFPPYTNFPAGGNVLGAVALIFPGDPSPWLMGAAALPAPVTIPPGGAVLLPLNVIALGKDLGGRP